MPAENELSEPEIVKRREDALKKMLNTPHQPHKAASGKRKPTKSRSVRARPKSV